MSRARTSKELAWHYSKHRLYELKHNVKVLGKRALDQRTSAAKALTHWRAELVDDLDGERGISKQQHIVVDLCVKTHLLLQSIDNWMRQKTLINARKKTLIPVLKEQQQLADSLVRYMSVRGLQKKVKPLPALSEYIAKVSGRETSQG